MRPKRARPSFWRSANFAGKSALWPRAANPSPWRHWRLKSAAREAQKGAEIISAAAEEQAAAAAEALRSVEQQAGVLDESQVASRSLSVLATDLKLASTSEPAPISSPPRPSSSPPLFRKCRDRPRRS